MIIQKNALLRDLRLIRGIKKRSKRSSISFSAKLEVKASPLTTSLLISTLPFLAIVAAPPAYSQAGGTAALPPNPSMTCTINWHRWRSARQNGRRNASAVNPTTHGFEKIDTALGTETWYAPTQTFNPGVDSFDNIANDNYGLSVFDETVENPTSGRATRTGEGYYAIAKFELEPNVTAIIPLNDPSFVDGHSFIAFDSSNNPLSRFPSVDSITNDGKFYIAANSQASAGFVDADGIDFTSSWTNSSFEVDVPADGIIYVHYVLVDEGAAHRHALRYCPQDVGDAPASYGTASHIYTLGLNIGIRKDIDINITGNGSANSDDSDSQSGVSDEDGVASFPVLSTTATSYSLNVSHSNSVGTARLHAWIDFDGNGTFDTDEYVSAPVSSGSASTTLNWSSLPGIAEGNTYARFRLTTDTLADDGSTTVDERAAGSASDGEVEDHAVTITAAPPDADLVTIKTLTSGDDTPAAGDTVTFQIAVRNDGPADATNVSLTDLLPNGLTATTNNGTTDDGAGNAVGTYDDTSGIWNIGNLANGDTVTLTLEGEVDAGESGNTIENVTTAAIGDQPDPTTTGDDLTESVTVLVRADLSITKTNTPGENGEIDPSDDTVITGSSTTYTIRVTNNGPDSVTGAVVTDTPGSGLTCNASDPVTLSGDGVPAGTFTIADLTGSGITLGNLDDGQTTIISYSCEVN